jgi:uncharacterized protein YjbI with pentapeptide repeats
MDSEGDNNSSEPGQTERAVSDEAILAKILAGQTIKFDLNLPKQRRRISAAILSEAAASSAKIEIQNAVISGALLLRETIFEQHVWLINCEFENPVDFSFSTFRRNLVLNGSTFCAGVRFESVKIESNAVFKETKFLAGSAVFKDLHVHGFFLGHKMSFQDGVNADFSYSRFEKSAFLRDSVFGGGLAFVGVTVSVDAEFQGVRFKRKVSFNHLRVAGALMLKGEVDPPSEPAVLEDEGDFTWMEIGTALFCQGTTFKKEVVFSSTVVEGSVFFQGAIFKSRADFNGIRVERSVFFRDDPIRGLHAAGFEGEVDFTGAQLGFNAEFQGVLFKGKASFNHVHVAGSLAFYSGEGLNATFDGEVDFGWMEVGIVAGFQAAIFEQEVKFGSAKIGGDGFFQGTIFKARALFPSMKVGGSLHFCADFQPVLAGPIFKNEARFDDIDVGGNVDFGGATFEKSVSFVRGHIAGDAGFRKARFRERATFERAKIDGSALFSNEDNPAQHKAEFDGIVDFTDAHIIGNAEFQEVKFRAAVTLDSAQVGKSAFFEGSTFNCGVDLTGFEVGQDAVFDEAIFCSGPVSSVPKPGPASDSGKDSDAIIPQEIKFNEMRAHGDILFEGALFRGKTSFDDAVIDGVGRFDDAKFEGGSKPSFAGAHFRRGAFFCNTTFGEGVDFHVARFEVEAVFSGARFHKRAGFEACEFTCVANFQSGERDEKQLPGAVFSEVSFEHARFREDARFDDVVFRKRANFFQASFRALCFSPSGVVRRRRRQFRDKIDLRGCVYERIQGHAQVLVDQFDSYDRQPFVQLENSLRRVGRDTEADEVHIRRHDVERKKNFADRDFGTWFGRWLYKLIANYGVRPYRLIAIPALLLFLGTTFFMQPRTVLPAEKNGFSAPSASIHLSPLEAFGVSIHQFLPVDVPLGSRWAPSEDRVDMSIWLYYRSMRLCKIPSDFYATAFLRIPGWVLVPLGIAALTGILRRVAR